MKRFIGHYVEMVVAMFVGMGVLALPWMLIWPDLDENPVADTLVMAANMTIGMAAWMGVRGHDRRMIVEMSAAMVAPFLVLLVPYATGAVTADTLMMGGHTLMFVTMLAAMLLRREDYMHRHGRPLRTRRQPAEARPADDGVKAIR
jgi:hypothetical protein